MAKKSMNELINQINSALDGVIETSPLNTNLEESMQYSLNAGGKRIRPLLVFLTLDVLNQDYKGKNCIGIGNDSHVFFNS